MPSYSGIYLEPYLGMSNGTGDSKYTSTSDYSHKYSGPTYGAKLGWMFKKSRFYFGADSSQSSFVMDSEQSGAYASDEVTKKQMGIFVGKMISSFKLWGIYYLSGSIEGKDSEAVSGNQFISTKNEISDMSGFGAGLSFYIGSSFQLNLEYHSLTYDSLTTNGAKNTNFTESSFTEYLITLSLPLGDGKK